MSNLDIKTTVVLFFAESFSSPEVAWSLSDSGFRVFAAARRNSRAAIRVSRYAQIFDVTAPEQDAIASVNDLKTQIGKLLADPGSRVALLPLDDAAVWMCSHLQADGRFTIVGPKDANLALDKEAQLSLAKETGFNVPETMTVGDADSIQIPSFGFPLILKPLRSISLNNGKLGKGHFSICRDVAQFEAAIRKNVPWEPMLAQKFITGTGEGLFGLALEGEVAAWSSHRRIRMMNPLGSGASACVSIPAASDRLVAGARFISASDWRGPFMIELLKDDTGKTWFMEFNGRIWGSTALARRCNLEYPAWAVANAFDPSKKPPFGIQPLKDIVCRHAGRELMHGLFVMRGPKGQVSGKWPSRWKTFFELLTIRKSDFWYNWRRDDWRVFVKDFLTTLEDNVLKKRSSPKP